MIKMKNRVVIIIVLVAMGILLIKYTLPLIQDENHSIEFTMDGNEWEYSSLDFIMDSTLQRQYVNDYMTPVKISNKDVNNETEVYNLVDSYLNNVWERNSIAIQKPFHVHLVDTIWVIKGSMPRLKNGDKVIGGTFYMEVDKHGILLKMIHTE